MLLLTSPCCIERARHDMDRDEPARWHLTWHHTVFCQQSCPSPRPTGKGGQAGGSQPRARKGWSKKSNRLAPRASSRARGTTLFGERPPSQGSGVEAKLEQEIGPVHGESEDR